jgi:hypothetical protein
LWSSFRSRATFTSFGSVRCLLQRRGEYQRGLSKSSSPPESTQNLQRSSTSLSRPIARLYGGNRADEPAHRAPVLVDLWTATGGSAGASVQVPGALRSAPTTATATIISAMVFRPWQAPRSRARLPFDRVPGCLSASFPLEVAHACERLSQKRSRKSTCSSGGVHLREVAPGTARRRGYFRPTNCYRPRSCPDRASSASAKMKSTRRLFESMPRRLPNLAHLSVDLGGPLVSLRRRRTASRAQTSANPGVSDMISPTTRKELDDNIWTLTV